MKIDVIGSGNVATHLQHMFAPYICLKIVNSRTLETLRRDCDLYLISVSDNAITEVASRLRDKLNKREALVAHTSGTTPMDALKSVGFTRVAVFYPLQTFTKEIALDYSQIPFFIESTTPDDAKLLMHLPSLCGAKSYQANSIVRRNLHLASVLSCNFVNHLWHLASEQLKESNIPFDVLRPLISETMRKLDNATPYEAQTGPARRHDTITLKRHMEMLESTPKLHDIYKLLTESIMEIYERN